MKQKNETKVKQIITNKFGIICSPSFSVLFFKNNLIKKIDIKIKSPIGIRKAEIKELVNKVIIKISNGLTKQAKRVKIGIIIKNNSINEIH